MPYAKALGRDLPERGAVQPLRANFGARRVARPAPQNPHARTRTARRRCCPSSIAGSIGDGSRTAPCRPAALGTHLGQPSLSGIATLPDAARCSCLRGLLSGTRLVQQSRPRVRGGRARDDGCAPARRCARRCVRGARSRPRASSVRRSSGGHPVLGIQGRDHLPVFVEQVLAKPARRIPILVPRGSLEGLTQPDQRSRADVEAARS
jgi:hypothetical protein